MESFRIGVCQKDSNKKTIDQTYLTANCDGRMEDLLDGDTHGINSGLDRVLLPVVEGGVDGDGRVAEARHDDDHPQDLLHPVPARDQVLAAVDGGLEQVRLQQL